MSGQILPWRSYPQSSYHRSPCSYRVGANALIASMPCRFANVHLVVVVTLNIKCIKYFKIFNISLSVCLNCLTTSPLPWTLFRTLVTLIIHNIMRAGKPISGRVHSIFSHRFVVVSYFSERVKILVFGECRYSGIWQPSKSNTRVKV